MLHKTSLTPCDAAATCVEKIYRVIRRHQDSIDTPGLMTGHLGISLFYHLYAQHSHRRQCLRMAHNQFEKALLLIISQPEATHSGFIELSLVANFLGTCEIPDPSHGNLSTLDKVLLEKMRSAFQAEYVGGFSCGALSYALHFLNRSLLYPTRYRWVIGEIVRGLRSTAVSGPSACHWCYDQRFSSTLWNGQAAVILFLTRLAELKLEKAEIISEMLINATGFLLSQQKHQTTTDMLSVQAGDLGIGYALLRAGQTLKNNSWQSVGLQILGARAGKILTIQDTELPLGMLNGAAGAAVVFEKIYALTANPLFIHAAEHSYRALLLAQVPSDTGPEFLFPRTELSFATGISGIGAALIQMLYPQRVNLQPLLWLL